MSESPPIWIFGILAIITSSILYITTHNIDIAIGIALLLGMPTWFVSLLFIGIKADKFFGVENAFGYETVNTENDG